VKAFQSEGMEIAPRELFAALESGVALRLLDVRHAEEHAIVRLDGAMLVTAEMVEDVTKNWHKATPIVTYCHHGVRSLNAAHWLKSQGFTHVKSLSGGIHAWAEEIDPSLPRY